jgi:hypothetical protein
MIKVKNFMNIFRLRCGILHLIVKKSFKKKNLEECKPKKGSNNLVSSLKFIIINYLSITYNKKTSG